MKFVIKIKYQQFFQTTLKVADLLASFCKQLNTVYEDMC